MTSAAFLKSCLAPACANTLLLRSSHPLSVHRASAVVARRTTRSNSTSVALTASTRRRHRRNCPSPTVSPYRRRRTSCAAYFPDFLRKAPLPHSFPLHKPPSRRTDASRRNSRQELTMEQVASLHQSLEEVVSQPAPSPQRRSQVRNRNDTQPRFVDGEISGPLAPRLDDASLIETRSERSASTASRISNRLSLTLPIAPPNPLPSRPTPASSTTASFPSTPLDTPGLMSPVDPNDFITAIAAQERRVLELREELNRAESDLSRLKKQWATHEAHKKRTGRRNVEPLRLIPPFSDAADDGTPRASVELERRKALLLGQQSQPNTPERSRRRVFQGGHARTLSLLSPTKSTGGFSVHEDEPESPAQRFDEGNLVYTDRYAPITPSQLAKRASWAPRSAQQTAGVKQYAQELKAGLWTFVEDLRQATIGDEPITGQGMYLRGTDGNMRATSPGFGGDQDTIRASGANPRPRVSTAFDDTPTQSSRYSDEQKPENKQGEAAPSRQTHTRSKTESQKPTKRFSWTPLTIDSIDDNDWSNWDSPSVNSPRWSGTTINGDIIPTIPEKHDENNSPLKKKASKSQLPSNNSSQAAAAANKLEELLPPVLNRLTPSNFKRTASDFMKEWEKSLSPPTPPVAREMTSMSGSSVDRERSN